MLGEFPLTRGPVLIPCQAHARPGTYEHKQGAATTLRHLCGRILVTHEGYAYTCACVYVQERVRVGGSVCVCL